MFDPEEYRARDAVGMHFAGRVGEDALLLRPARQLQAAAPWIGRRPPDPR